jgi:ABC-type transporter Mla maintaining outer membrane lipid asymmetry ATPase subunit MlaF
MAVRKFIAIMKNWLGVMVKIFHYDNERSAGNDVEALIEAEGCTLEHSAPCLPERNGPAERSGGMIVSIARALLNDTDLTWSL